MQYVCDCAEWDYRYRVKYECLVCVNKQQRNKSDNVAHAMIDKESFYTQTCIWEITTI